MKPIIVNANIVDAPDTVSPPGPPYSYLGVAENLLPGVRVLADAPNTKGTPLAFLSAHVLECLLKAYLFKALGDCLKDDHKLRHNLSALWALAKQHGLALSDPAPTWVGCLSGIHDHPFHLRYSKQVHVIVSPEPEPMATDLHNLVSVVRDSIK